MPTFKYILTTFFISTTLVWANEGQELHQAQCIECHSNMTGGDGSVLYKRDDKIVQSMLQLEKRVTHCATGADTDWDKVQLKAVIDYLNKNFYLY